MKPNGPGGGRDPAARPRGLAVLVAILVALIVAAVLVRSRDSNHRASGPSPSDGSIRSTTSRAHKASPSANPFGGPIPLQPILFPVQENPSFHNHLGGHPGAAGPTEGKGLQN